MEVIDGVLFRIAPKKSGGIDSPQWLPDTEQGKKGSRKKEEEERDIPLDYLDKGVGMRDTVAFVYHSI